MSVEQENIDIIKLLLEHPDIDVNKKSIFNHFVFWMSFLIILFLNFVSKKNFSNKISNQIFINYI